MMVIEAFGRLQDPNRAGLVGANVQTVYFNGDHWFVLLSAESY
jgi:hypothetical protein